VQRLEDVYPLVLDVCRTITVNYKDLAHDVILKLNSDTKFKSMPFCELRSYIYIVARNHHRNLLKKDRFVELSYSPADQSQEVKPDPFEIYEKIFEFQKQHEILGIVLELYYQFEGNISSIERDMKQMGFSLTRQTLTKYYNQAQEEFKKWME